jgi:hypothetical protein
MGAEQLEFQPLLYQVATSVLSPGQIGSPIRGILKNQKNATVIRGEVTGVDKDRLMRAERSKSNAARRRRSLANIFSAFW